MPCKLALVDFDGTLVDSMPYWLDLPCATLRQYGIPQPADFQDRIRARPMWEIALEMTAEFPVLSAERSLRDRWDDAMLENYRQHIPRKAGAKEYLRLLREEGAAVYILSATREPYLSQALEHHGFLPLVDRVCDERMAGSKHEESTYRRLAEEFGCSVSEVLLTDDAPLNIITASRAGCATLAVREETYAYQVPELQENAGLYVPTLTETDAIRSYLRSL